MKKEIIMSLLEEAKKTAFNSYSPYSSFRVGAALLTKEGKLYTGTNIENRSFSGTICAERVAMSHALSDGHREFYAIGIVGIDSSVILPPCGICRQFISEFGWNIKIIMADKNLKYKIRTIKELLPYDSLHNLKSITK